MVTFKFGNEEILLSENAISNDSTVIGGRFNKLATKEMMQFRDAYKSSAISVSNVASISAKLGQDCINRGINAAIDTLLENGIFDYDAARFMAQDPVFLFTSRKAYNDQMRGLDLLNQKEQQQQAARDAQRAGRSRWVGGGFGVKGAVKGAVTAGAMNAVTDIFRGMGDLSKDSEKYAEFLEKKKEYIHAAEFVDSLGRDISNCIKEDIKGRLFSILSECVPGFAVSDSTDSQRATALFNNLSRLNPSQQQKALAQAIQLEPHNWKYIQYAYDHLDALGVAKEDVDRLAQLSGQEMSANASPQSADASTYKFDYIDQIPFSHEQYAAEVKEVAKKYGSNTVDLLYIRDTLSVAYKYSLIDEQLNVLPKNDEELATAYHAIFVCAALEICISLGRWNINGILFDAEHSYSEKSHIIFSVCSKYHLVSGTDESFCLSSDLVKKMQRLTASTLKQYKFIVKLVDRLAKFRDREIVIGSEKTGVAYLKEICEKRLASTPNAVIGAPIEKNSKKLLTFRKNCSIPENDDVYVLGDTSLLCNGKKGFALTATGFYHNLNKSTEYWDWKTFAQKSIEVKDDQRFSIGEVTSNQLDDETLYSVVSILISMQKDARGESHPVLNDHISPATMSETMDSDLPEDHVQTYILTHFNASSKLQAIKYYREQTGADSEAAKLAVDKILK